MRYKSFVFLIILGIISIIGLIKGLTLIHNSLQIALNRYHLLDYTLSTNFIKSFGSSQEVVKQFLQTIIIRGIIISMLSGVALLFSLFNTYKELKKL